MNRVEPEITQVSWQTHKEALLAIRFDVFVNEQQVPPELEIDIHDPQATHLIARIADDFVGTARMLTDGHIGRVAVRKPWRHQGVGHQLMQHLINAARSQHIPHVYLNAQCDALAFYNRLGFAAEGPVFDDAGIPHRRMTLSL